MTYHLITNPKFKFMEQYEPENIYLFSNNAHIDDSTLYFIEYMKQFTKTVDIENENGETIK